MLLENKVALVTGASRGIGQGILLALGKAGATVVGTATSEEGTSRIKQAIQEENFKGTGMILNVTSAESVEEVLSRIKEQLGPINILVNNAAITKDNLLLRMKDDEWMSVLDTNLTSVYRISKICLRDMLKNRWGRIINIGSVVGSTGNPGQTNYCAAKAGVLGFTKSLAQEVGSRNVTVNTIAPGFIDTDMTRSLSDELRQALIEKIPLQRIGSPEDIASAVVFFASDAAGYITGQTLQVNGGMYME